MEAGSLPTTKSALGAGRIIDARRRIKNLPLWLFALLTVADFNAIALGGLVCTRRLGTWLGLYTLIDNDTLGWIFSAILVMYALSLGLIAVASWGNASAAAAAASEEASHIATVYRTVRLFEEAGILAKHDFGDGRARYEETPSEHHDHLIDIQSGKVVEFHNDEIEDLQRRIAEKAGYRLVGHRLELFGVPLDGKSDRQK